MAVTVDTHALVWYLDKSLNHKLSRKALTAIRAGEADTVYLSVVVLMEMLYLIEKGRVKLSFDALLKRIEESTNYHIVPFDIELLHIAKTVEELEFHDGLIVATALITGSALVSKDRAIKAQRIDVIW